MIDEYMGKDKKNSSFKKVDNYNDTDDQIKWIEENFAKEVHT